MCLKADGVLSNMNCKLLYSKGSNTKTNSWTAVSIFRFELFVFVCSGCVIAELFTEGVPLFDLSQLLAYRKGHFQTEQVLMKIEDRSIRELVMISVG